MKNILLITGLAASLTAAAQAADDSLLPPRAKQLFPKMVQRAPSEGPNLVHVGPMGPAAKFPVTRERTVPGISENEPNLITRPLYTGKNPVRELRGQRAFEVAPLGKGKACEPGCTKPCCPNK